MVGNKFLSIVSPDILPCLITIITAKITIEIIHISKSIKNHFLLSYFDEFSKNQAEDVKNIELPKAPKYENNIKKI